MLDPAPEGTLHRVARAMADVAAHADADADARRRARRVAAFLPLALSLLPDDPADRAEALREARQHAAALLAPSI